MDMVALIHECEERLAQAVNRGDLDAIVDLHTGDCWVLAPGQPLTRGTEAVRAAFEEPLQMGALSPPAPKCSLQSTTCPLCGHHYLQGFPLRVLHRC